MFVQFIADWLQSAKTTSFIYVVIPTLVISFLWIQIYTQQVGWKHSIEKRLQIHVIRIMLMVPLYSICSYLGLIFPSVSVLFRTIRECYEALALYSFYSMLSLALGGDRSLGLITARLPPQQHPWPLDSCFPPFQRGSTFVWHTKVGTLQFVLVKPFLVVVSLICEMFGVLGEGSMNFKKAYIYIAFLTSVSQMYAIYCMALLYLCVRDDISPIRPLHKFFSIKMIIFFTYWQGLGLSVMLAMGAIANNSNLSPDIIAIQIQEFLVCVEMLLFALYNIYAFRASDFKDIVQQQNDRLDLIKTEKNLQLLHLQSSRVFNNSKNNHNNNHNNTNFLPNDPNQSNLHNSTLQTMPDYNNTHDGPQYGYNSTLGYHYGPKFGIHHYNPQKKAHKRLSTSHSYLVNPAPGDTIIQIEQDSTSSNEELLHHQPHSSSRQNSPRDNSSTLPSYQRHRSLNSPEHPPRRPNDGQRDTGGSNGVGGGVLSTPTSFAMRLLSSLPGLYSLSPGTSIDGNNVSLDGLGNINDGNFQNDDFLNNKKQIRKKSLARPLPNITSQLIIQQYEGNNINEPLQLIQTPQNSTNTTTHSPNQQNTHKTSKHTAQSESKLYGRADLIPTKTAHEVPFIPIQISKSIQIRPKDAIGSSFRLATPKTRSKSRQRGKTGAEYQLFNTNFGNNFENVEENNAGKWGKFQNFEQFEQSIQPDEQFAQNTPKPYNTNSVLNTRHQSPPPSMTRLNSHNSHNTQSGVIPGINNVQNDSQNPAQKNTQKNPSHSPSTSTTSSPQKSPQITPPPISSQSILSNNGSKTHRKDGDSIASKTGHFVSTLYGRLTGKPAPAFSPEELNQQQKGLLTNTGNTDLDDDDDDGTATDIAQQMAFETNQIAGEIFGKEFNFGGNTGGNGGGLGERNLIYRSQTPGSITTSAAHQITNQILSNNNNTNILSTGAKHLNDSHILNSKPNHNKFSTKVQKLQHSDKSHQKSNNLSYNHDIFLDPSLNSSLTIPQAINSPLSVNTFDMTLEQLRGQHDSLDVDAIIENILFERSIRAAGGIILDQDGIGFDTPKLGSEKISQVINFPALSRISNVIGIGNDDIGRDLGDGGNGGLNEGKVQDANLVQLASGRLGNSAHFGNISRQNSGIMTESVNVIGDSNTSTGDGSVIGGDGGLDEAFKLQMVGELGTGQNNKEKRETSHKNDKSIGDKSIGDKSIGDKNNEKSANSSQKAQNSNILGLMNPLYYLSAVIDMSDIASDTKSAFSLNRSNDGNNQDKIAKMLKHTRLGAGQPFPSDILEKHRDYLNNLKKKQIEFRDEKNINFDQNGIENENNFQNNDKDQNKNSQQIDPNASYLTVHPLEDADSLHDGDSSGNSSQGTHSSTESHQFDGPKNDEISKNRVEEHSPNDQTKKSDQRESNIPPHSSLQDQYDGISFDLDLTTRQEENIIDPLQEIFNNDNSFNIDFVDDFL